MILIGITGPTGAGKTTLLREVEALGGAVIDCDVVYHELLEGDRLLQCELERRFGPLRGEDGAIDRKRLGAIVFGDPEKLALLWELCAFDPSGPAHHINFGMLEETHCRLAFLRGAFLALSLIHI